MNIMRENPATLQAAVASAMNEQNLRNRFNLKIRRVTESNVPSIEPWKLTIYGLNNLVLNVIR